MVNLPRWQRFIILGLVLLGCYLAAPNLFYGRVEAANDAAARIASEQALEGDADLAASAPAFLPREIVNLGLDLRGGVHAVVEVQLAEVYKERYNSLWATLRDEFASDIKFTRIPDDNRLILAFADDAAALDAVGKMQTLAEDLGEADYSFVPNGAQIAIELTPTATTRIDENTMARSLEIVRRRIDGAGTKEPTIQRIGEDRILIDVPGFGSVKEVLDVLGKTAKLTLHPVLGFAVDENQAVDFDQMLLPSRDQGYVILDRAAVVVGEMIREAQLGFDQGGQPAVNFTLNTEGAKAFGDYTANHIGEPFAIVLDGEVLSAPTIQAYIAGGSAQITGGFSVEEAEQLAVLLRSGALPAGLVVLEQSVVGPDLGQDSIDAGALAAGLALFSVGLYMLWVFRIYGVFANIALAVNMAMIVGLLSTLGSVLTLPGIAGIVLTIGMAVDANVLIFERIREEYKAKPVLIRAIDQGFARATASILDANVTTLIAAIVLYIFGSGPIRGFAITLSIGIITSVFTAVFFTRLMVVWYLERRRPRTLAFSEGNEREFNFTFMARAKGFLRVSLLLMIISLAAFFTKGPNYGIDFRGGTIVKMQVDQTVSLGDVRAVVSANVAGDIAVTTNSDGDDGKQGMFIRISSDGDKAAMSEQEIENLKAVIFKNLPSAEIRGVDSIGGAVSGETVQKGLTALSITLVAIGIYIWLRFEWGFSLGAIFALFHDVALTLGLFVFGALTFDLSVVAALLAIIGYSLNDTVIVYDRIRERLNDDGETSDLATVIDYSINQTLRRTLMTSGTTALAVLMLIIFGGAELRGFSIAMLWGVAVGTYSSIFVASPILTRIGYQHHTDKPKSKSKFADIDA